MKKVFVIALIVLLSVSAAFADASTAILLKTEVETKAEYKPLKSKFIPTDARMLGMGGAGIAVTKSANGLWFNPASLGAYELQLSMPSMTVTVNHVYDLVRKDGSGKSIVDNIMQQVNDNSFDVITLGSMLLPVIGSDYGKIADVDVAASMILPMGLGFGVSSKTSVLTYSESSPGNSAVIAEEALSAAVGLGAGFDIGDYNLKAGAVVKFNGLIFNQSLTAQSLLEDPNMESRPAAFGWAIPIDLGVTVETPFGLNGAVVLSNLNGKYKMDGTLFEDFNGLEKAFNTFLSNSNQFEIETPASLDAGLSYTLGKKSLLGATLAVDVVDILHISDDAAKTAEPMRAYLKHLNAGLEVDLASVLAARVGMSQGYFSAGASFNLMLMRVDAAYYWKEFGTVAGQKAVDAFSIRFNLGFDR